MKRLQPFAWAAFGALLVLLTPVASAQVGIAYTSFANVFTANQRINAGVGVNVAPGATGTLSLSDRVFEQSRSTAMGEWIDVAYASGNFTASGGGTWTVDSGDQAVYRYALVGHTIALTVKLQTTSVSGTVNTLRIAIPGGFTAKNSTEMLGDFYDNSASVATVGLIFYSSGGSTIAIQKLDGSNFTASTNNTYVRLNSVFEVQ